MAYEQYSTGVYTKQQVLDIVTEAGLRTRSDKKLAKQEMDRILANPIYAGWIKIHRWSERKKGKFEPIVDEAMFDRVQAILSGRKPALTPFQKHHPDFPLRLFIRCSQCGQAITGSWSRGRNKKYPYYHCAGRCHGINLRKEKLEAKFVALLEQMQVLPEHAELFRKIVLDQWEKRNDSTLTALAAFQREIKELEKQKEQLIDAFIYEKAINREIYDKRLDKLEEEITLAKMRMHDSQLDEVDLESVLSFAQKFLLDPARLWLEMSLEQRQRFQLVLFPKGIELLPNGEVGTVVTSPIIKMLQPKTGDETKLAGVTGLEPATSAVAGQRSEPITPTHIASRSHGSTLTNLRDVEIIYRVGLAVGGWLLEPLAWAGLPGMKWLQPLLPETRILYGYSLSSIHNPIVVLAMDAFGSICHHLQSLHNPHSLLMIFLRRLLSVAAKTTSPRVAQLVLHSACNLCTIPIRCS